MRLSFFEMKNHSMIFVCVVLQSFWPVTAKAQWSTDPGENTAVTNSQGMITMPHVAMTPSGNSYISWYSATEGFRFDSYLQCFGINGNKLWGTEGLLVSNHPTFTWVSDYGLAVDKKGYAILAFQDIRDGVSNAFAYRIAPDGTFNWGADGIRITDNPDENWWPQITVTDDNESIFLYSDIPSNDSIDNWKIGFQKVDSTGNKVWNETILFNPDLDYYMPQMLPTEQGNLIISWLAKSGTPDTVMGQINFFHVYLQKYDHNGQPMWANPIQADSGNHMAFNSVYTIPYLVNNGADGAYVVWQSVSLGVPTVRVNNIATDGTALWKASGIEAETNLMLQSMSPSAYYDKAADKLYVFYLVNGKNVTSWSVGGQKLSTEGERLWGNEAKLMVPYLYSVDSSYIASFIRPAPENRLCLFYEKAYKSVSGNDTLVQGDLYAGLLDADGNYIWPGDNVLVSSAVGNKLYFTAGEYSEGQWITAWTDYRQHPLQALFSNIYAQNVSINGTLGPLSAGEPARVTSPVLTCYPNPACDVLHIQIDGVTGLKGDVEVKIYDIQGKEILNGNYSRTPFNFDIKSLKPGMYILGAKNNQYVFNQKLIVQ